MNRRTFLSASASMAIALAARRASAADKRWRVGVIGHTGKGDYGHGLHTMWLSLPETEIVGVADPNPKGLENARKKLNNPPGFADFRQMLAETKPEIVAICTR